jgi:hypothetical protein
METASRRLAHNITADLQGAAIPAKKAWWEKYLKGVISFELLRGDVAEQKLAGILILQLLPHCQLTVEDLTESYIHSLRTVTFKIGTRAIGFASRY